MADKPLAKQRKEARSKGLAALGSAGATAVLSAFLTTFALVPGIPITAYLTYRWLAYRAEWGMKF
jgi:hypothetical protein